MIETVSVSLTGPSFSFLLYENLKNKFSQEGFLIGELIEKETKTITDNDQQQVHISKTIKVSCAVPCPHPFYFYDAIGRISETKIRNFLGDLTPKVVAWYKYKPSASFSFTFREKLIHKQLANIFSLPSELFSYCLLISERSDNSSTHSFTQTFTRFHNNNYEPLPMHIVNLSDPHYLYKNPEQVSETFSKIVSALDINHKETLGINIITKVQHALHKHIDEIIDNLSAKEERLFQLENEVKLLKQNKEHDFTSASKKENQLNDKMDTDCGLPLNGPKKCREKTKTTPKTKRTNSQSPVKKSSDEHEIVTRSKKKV